MSDAPTHVLVTRIEGERYKLTALRAVSTTITATEHELEQILAMGVTPLKLLSAIAQRRSTGGAMSFSNTPKAESGAVPRFQR